MAWYWWILIVVAVIVVGPILWFVSYMIFKVITAKRRGPQSHISGSGKAMGPEGAPGVIQGTTVGELDPVVVELKSGVLAVFDLPYEGARYKIKDFEPGMVQIPVSAIKKAPEPDEEPEVGNLIEVDTGMMFFIDEQYLEKFKNIEKRLWEETQDTYSLISRYDDIVAELGIKFNYLVAPGVGSGYDFEGDGAYILDLSLVNRVE